MNRLFKTGAMAVALIAAPYLALAEEPAAAPPEAAPQAAAPAPATDAPAKAAADVVTCSNEFVTGSRLSRRVCMSEAERQAQRENAQRALNAAQRRTSARGGS